MNKLTHLYLQEVLDKNRLDILEKLIQIKEMWFILWWWTWLALMFGHRESIDFDFFIPKNLDTIKLFEKCLDIFSWFEIIKTFEEKNTLYISVNWVKISFFTYNYENVSDIISTKYFNIYSVDDISAMKIWAIQNRATNKDYVDIYYIIREIWLEKVISNFFNKFWHVISKTYLLKSLVYFDDIINEPLILKDKNLSFEDIKKYLNTEILKCSN